MKSYVKFLAVAPSLGLSLQALADGPRRLEGAFVNQNQEPRTAELAFWPAGQASFSGIRAIDVVADKDDGRVITLIRTALSRGKSRKTA